MLDTSKVRLSLNILAMALPLRKGLSNERRRVLLMKSGTSPVPKIPKKTEPNPNPWDIRMYI